MKSLLCTKVHVNGLFNSFKPRTPEDVRYHRTLQIPSRTTLLGFVGAALGLGEQELYVQWNGGPPLSERLEATAVLNEIKGHIVDYWTIVKFVERKQPLRAIQVREQLFKPSYTLYFASSEEEIVKGIRDSIHDPRFVLSLGRDDELVRVTGVHMLQIRPPKQPFTLANILIPLDIIPKLAEKDRLDLLASLTRFRLTRSFHIDENGTRTVNDEREYAQLTSPVSVVGHIEAYTDASEGAKGNNIVFL
jgi:CRISPR-associated Cas5-like protein